MITTNQDTITLHWVAPFRKDRYKKILTMRILGSFIFSRSYRISRKAYWMLPRELHEIQVGKMLGDGYAEKPSIKHNTRVQFHHSENVLEYISHLWSLFSDYCYTKPACYVRQEKRPNRTPETVSYKFWTLSLPCFNLYREQFYDINGTKKIPSNLGSHLTPLGLAYWFMDDGYLVGSGFYLCTESFSIADHDLVDWINRLASYHSSHRLFIPGSSRDLFQDLISPYVLPCFQYKLSNK